MIKITSERRPVNGTG